MRPRSLLPFVRGPDLPFVHAADDQGRRPDHGLARQDLDASHRRLSNQAVVAVYSCDASGVIDYYNNRAAELWGRKPDIRDTDERFCGSSMLYRADGTHMPHEQCPMARVLSGEIGGIYDAEVHIGRPDGSRVIVIVNIAPMIDDTGKIVGAINSFYDINDLKNPKA